MQIVHISQNAERHGAFCNAEYSEGLHFDLQHCLQDFADYVLPSLIPVFMTANGQALFQLIRSADILYQVMQPYIVVDVLIPLLARAADIGG